MKLKLLSIVVGSLTVLLLAVGVAGAALGWQQANPLAATSAVSSGISYQGRLTSASGSPLSGTFSMRFIVYDAAEGGSAVWDSGSRSVLVESGLFATTLDVDSAEFNGQALWVSIIVEGETLSPRQEILPAPYALSLRPAADIMGDDIAPADATLAGYAPATGMALHGDANGGAGMVGSSQGNVGVWGTSTNSWGGYFTSTNGYGIRVETSGSDHYDHGAYISSNGGYAVYAQSNNNMAVRGEAGDVSGIALPLGTVGVVGIGANRGMFGASDNGLGVYGTSQETYGVWGQSSNYRGVTGRTNRVDNNYGFYTPDNLFAANINMSGALMMVMQNNGEEALSPGDVVVFSGVNRDVAGMDGPVVQVSKTTQANSSAVAGVVFSRFNLDALEWDEQLPDDVSAEALAALEVTPAGDAAANEFVLVVVQGPAEVNASALAGAIQPGDVLTTASSAGLAAKAEQQTTDGVVSAEPGSVFAKALESVESGQKRIYVFVTLQ